MTRKSLLFLIAAFTLLTALPAEAYWVWSPELGKWTNPKKASKDTPEDQYNWAMEFYKKKDYDRAIDEFEKLPQAFPNSRLAAEGVYHAGLAWEAKNDLAKAADAYQRLVDRYPYSDRIKDAMNREFEIANQFASGEKMKVYGMPLLSGQEKALEIYRHIVKNAPYGSFGDQAQFQIGEVYKAQGEFELAQKAYQSVVDEYPSSPLVTKARYQIAQVSLEATKKSQYNEQYAERAIQEFEGFKKNFPDDQQVIEADESIKILRSKKAQNYWETAHFYERQGKFKSARIYYEQIVTTYGDTKYAEDAKKKVDEMIKKDSEPQNKSLISLPKVGMPQMPKVSLPKPSMPKINLPKPSMPNLSLPWFGKPAPKAEAVAAEQPAA